MIEYTGATVLTGDTLPPLIYNERAMLSCGCGIAVGVRLDTREAATGAWPCTPEHLPMIEYANGLLQASTFAPRGVLLINVVDEFLHKAAHSFGVAIE